MKDANWQARLQQRIAHRWLYWEPWVVREMRTSVETINLENAKKAHAWVIARCLRHDIPWTTIVNSKLDNPLLTYKESDFNLKAAIERRRQSKEKQCRLKQNKSLTKP